MNKMMVSAPAEQRMSWDAETEHAYWLAREKSAVAAPEEIDVTAFHEAAGRMYPMTGHVYPMNWQSNGQDTETFMMQEMYCGNVTEIFTRIGARYFRMRDYSHLSHVEIVERVKEAMKEDGNTQM
ncbi:hypothetical protein [Photorhabdus sp. RM71S]|uniref:hypothetical protein n=1 Tax=Photorhabdus sp. RM71S TaxID=3342824 RepID=UPI0036DC8564